jgi:hypothetical protein
VDARERLTRKGQLPVIRHPEVNSSSHPKGNSSSHPRVNSSSHPKVNSSNYPEVNSSSHPKISSSPPKVIGSSHPMVNGSIRINYSILLPCRPRKLPNLKPTIGISFITNTRITLFFFFSDCHIISSHPSPFSRYVVEFDSKIQCLSSLLCRDYLSTNLKQPENSNVACRGTKHCFMLDY